MPKEIETEEEFNKCLNDNTNVVVDFFATWCGPCRAIAPHYVKLSEENPSVIFIKVDVDKNEEISKTYDIMSLPTFLFFIKNREVAKVVGADLKGIQYKVSEMLGENKDKDKCNAEENEKTNTRDADDSNVETAKKITDDPNKREFSNDYYSESTYKSEEKPQGFKMVRAKQIRRENPIILERRKYEMLFKKNEEKKKRKPKMVSKSYHDNSKDIVINEKKSLQNDEVVSFEFPVENAIHGNNLDVEKESNLRNSITLTIDDSNEEYSNSTVVTKIDAKPPRRVYMEDEMLLEKHIADTEEQGDLDLQNRLENQPKQKQKSTESQQHPKVIRSKQVHRGNPILEARRKYDGLLKKLERKNKPQADPVTKPDHNKPKFTMTKDKLFSQNMEVVSFELSDEDSTKETQIDLEKQSVTKASMVSNLHDVNEVLKNLGTFRRIYSGEVVQQQKLEEDSDAGETTAPAENAPPAEDGRCFHFCTLS